MKKSFSRRRYLIYQPPKLKSSMEVDKICCLCFTNESLLKLSGYKWNNANLFEILKYCLPLQDFTDDWHYQSLCASCISDLLQTYKFLNKSYTACEIIQKKMSPDYETDASAPNEKNFHKKSVTDTKGSDGQISEEEREFQKQITRKYKLLQEKQSVHAKEEPQQPLKSEKKAVKVVTVQANKRQIVMDDSKEASTKEKYFSKKPNIQEQLTLKDEDEELHLNGGVEEGSLIKKKRVFKQEDDKPYQNESDDYEGDEMYETPESPSIKCKFCTLKFVRHEVYLQHLKDQHMSKTECDNCGEPVSNGELEEHKAVCSLNELKCKECPEVFNSRREVEEHIEKAHEKKVECTICQEVFNSKDLLQKHILTHTNGSKFVCNVCGKEFSFKFNLQRHKMCHQGIKPFSCQRCGKEYTQKNNLKLHQKTCEQKPKEVKCRYCLQPFEDSCALTNHIRSEHNIEYQHIGPHDRVCKICNKEFRCRALLVEHQTIHTGEKNYPCHICKKRFRLNLHLKTHMLTHTEERKFGCELCNMKFKQKSHLMYHMSAIHEGDKRWKCQYCGKGFNLKGNLTVHIRIHTGEAPYICQVCNKGFIDSNRLKKHLRTLHVDESCE